MVIQRDSYLNNLISSRHNGMIKIVTGIRRCGKSYLLSKLFADWLMEHGVDQKHIIKINLEDRRNQKLRDPDVLLEYIDSFIKDDKVHYIMIDEIQHVPEFEDVLNSYLGMENADFYVTGSNARFLSKDVITTFRGRGYQIHVSPLSFKEFMQTTSKSKEDALDEYMLYGGLPQVVLLPEEDRKVSFLKELFTQTYVRDIIERYNLKNTEKLDVLISILASSIGSLTNPTNLAKAFESIYNEKVSRTTLTNYLEYLSDAFILEKSERYDIRGKRLIDSPFKFYFTDSGLRNARLNFRQKDFGHVMENMIYNELRKRGLNVDVGVLQTHYMKEGVRQRAQLEVDFVCNLGNKRYYIQSAWKMDSEEKIAQEERSLRTVEDSFKKILVVGYHTPLIRDESGITTMSIYDFLLKENSLEL